MWAKVRNHCPWQMYFIWLHRFTWAPFLCCTPCPYHLVTQLHLPWDSHSNNYYHSWVRLCIAICNEVFISAAAVSKHVRLLNSSPSWVSWEDRGVILRQRWTVHVLWDMLLFWLVRECLGVIVTCNRPKVQQHIQVSAIYIQYPQHLWECIQR